MESGRTGPSFTPRVDRSRPVGVVEARCLPVGERARVAPLAPAELPVDPPPGARVAAERSAPPVQRDFLSPGEDLGPEKRRRVVQKPRRGAEVVNLDSKYVRPGLETHPVGLVLGVGQGKPGGAVAEKLAVEPGREPRRAEKPNFDFGIAGERKARPKTDVRVGLARFRIGVPECHALHYTRRYAGEIAAGILFR